MQDKAPIHTAASIMNCLDTNGIELIPWSSYSPDLNLIENVWSMMMLFMQKQYPDTEEGKQNSKPEVRAMIQELWLYFTMEEKLRALI